jgi:hypothetical protein
VIILPTNPEIVTERDHIAWSKVKLQNELVWGLKEPSDSAIEHESQDLWDALVLMIVSVQSDADRCVLRGLVPNKLTAYSKVVNTWEVGRNQPRQFRDSSEIRYMASEKASKASEPAVSIEGCESYWAFDNLLIDMKRKKLRNGSWRSSYDALSSPAILPLSHPITQRLLSSS